MEAVIYTRVSTEEQANSGLGLEAQLERCRAMCVAKGLTVVGEFSDPGVSGRTPPESRKGLSAALPAIRAGRILVVHSVSRLTRKQRTLWELLDENGEYGLKLISATEPFDTSTPMGRAMIGMLGVWNQLEADLVSDRTKAALAARRARGLPLGHQGVAIKDPALADRIGAMGVIQGFKLREIVDTLNFEGIPGPSGGKWNTATVGRLVQRYREKSEGSGGAVEPVDPTT